MKKVGVKYCGGCNPSYDRVGFVTRLSSRYADKILIETVESTVVYDAIIVVGGCKVCCANHKDLTATHLKIIVASENDYSNTCEKLDKLIEATN